MTGGAVDHSLLDALDDTGEPEQIVGEIPIKAFRDREPWLDGRLVLSPHAAFYSPASLEDMQRKAIEVIVSHLRDGVLMNCVNREQLRRPLA